MRKIPEFLVTFRGQCSENSGITVAVLAVVIFCRFLDSEVELNDTIQEMHIIATTPELYHIVVELNTVQSLLQLLSHDNTGILDLFYKILLLQCKFLCIQNYSWYANL